jgi:hypothetical protein
MTGAKRLKEVALNAKLFEPRHDKTNMSAFATSMDTDQAAHPRSLIRIHAVRLQTLYQVDKLIANSMDPDQNARMLSLESNIICFILSYNSIFSSPVTK